MDDYYYAIKAKKMSLGMSREYKSEEIVREMRCVIEENSYISAQSPVRYFAYAASERKEAPDTWGTMNDAVKSTGII